MRRSPSGRRNCTSEWFVGPQSLRGNGPGHGARTRSFPTPLRHSVGVSGRHYGHFVA